MMPIQILINILLVVEYGWFRVEFHRYSHPVGQSSPFLSATIMVPWPAISKKSDPGSIEQWRVGSRVQRQKEKKNLVVSKTRVLEEAAQILLPIYTLKENIIAMIVWVRIKTSRRFSIQIKPSHRSQRTLSAKRRLLFFYARWLDAWFDSWPYRVRAILNAQDSKRYADYFSLTAKWQARP